MSAKSVFYHFLTSSPVDIPLIPARVKEEKTKVIAQ
jgi:hypothetical protein